MNRFDMLSKTKDILTAIPGSFLTGSRIYGGSAKDSDIDICVPCSAEPGVEKLLDVEKPADDSPERDYTGVNDVIYSRDSADGVRINIVLLRPTEMLAWFYATRALAEWRGLGMTFPEADPKSARVHAFWLLRDAWQIMAGVPHNWVNLNEAVAVVEAWKLKNPQDYEALWPVYPEFVVAPCRPK